MRTTPITQSPLKLFKLANPKAHPSFLVKTIKRLCHMVSLHSFCVLVFPVWPDMMYHVLSTWKPWVINSSFIGSCLWVCHLTILIKKTPGSLFKTLLDSQTVRTLSLKDMAKEQQFSKCAVWISSITLLEMHQLVRDANSQSPFRLPASETLGRGSRLFWHTLQLEKPYSLEAHGNTMWEHSC